jgi:hypothetical protein
MRPTWELPYIICPCFSDPDSLSTLPGLLGAAAEPVYSFEKRAVRSSVCPMLLRAEYHLALPLLDSANMHGANAG